MASGGYQPIRHGRSEPRQRANRQRSLFSDYDDAQSLSSFTDDTRVNNWDFAEQHPSNLDGGSKLYKKSKGNPERERDQSLLVESPAVEKKHHTPSSYPRTKITTNTPTSQRVALENLKQHMTFSDVEDDDKLSADGGRNNERQVSRNRHSLRNDTFNSTGLNGDARGAPERHVNRNNNTDSLSQEQSKDGGTDNKGDLEVLSEPHHDLIDILREKQQQLERLMSHQKVLDVRYSETAQKLMQAKTRDNLEMKPLTAVTAKHKLLENKHSVRQTLETAMKTTARGMNENAIHSETSLQDLLLSSNITGHPESESEENLMVSELAKNFQPTLQKGRQPLQNKLHELQNKKYQLDMLLQELQMFHSQQYDQSRDSETNLQDDFLQPTTNAASNFPNDLQLQMHSDTTSRTLSGLHDRMNKTKPKTVDNTIATFSNLASQANCQQEAGTMNPQVDQEVQEKLRCLTEVQEQLNILRSLVQYYQDKKDDVRTTSEQEDSRSLPRVNNGGNHIALQTKIEGHGNHSVQQKRLSHQQQQKLQQKPPQKLQLPLNEHRGQPQGKMKAVDTSSATSSHAVQILNLEENDDDSDEDNVSVSKLESRWPTLEQMDSSPEMLEKVRDDDDDDEFEVLEDSRTELERLRAERDMFMEIKSQLEEIKNQTSTVQHGGIQEAAKQNSHEKSGLNHTSNSAVVTFASKDELYSEIRQHILRGGLQSKKKEMNALMNKDRNKGQHSCNQENQSDVSSDNDVLDLTASVNAAMATWGGSTMDNLENITDDDDESGQDESHSTVVEEDDNDDNGSMSQYTDVKKSPRKSNIRRVSQEQQGWESRHKSVEKQHDDTVSDRQATDSHRSIEDRLVSLTAAVNTLLDKSKTRLNVPANQEQTQCNWGEHSPAMQELMIQLHNKSLMLCLSQLVQSVTRHQVDIQHLKQQIQSLHQQREIKYVSPAAQSGNYSKKGQGHSNFQDGRLLSQTFPQHVGRLPEDGQNSGLGVDHTIRTRPNMSVPQQDIATGISSVASGWQVLNQQRLHYHHHQASNDDPSVLTSTRNFDQIFHTLKSTSPPFGSADRDKGTQCESKDQLVQTDGCAPLVRGNTEIDEEYPLSRDWSDLFDTSRNKTRSTGCTSASNTHVNTLSDSIYTEAASLIFRNESRPYFLLKLFRQIRQVDSDWMRQQILNSMQELLRSNLKVAVSTNPFRLQEEIRTVERDQLQKQTRTSGTSQNLSWDYAEEVDEQSSCSTSEDGFQEYPTFQYSRTIMEQLGQQIKDIFAVAVPVVKKYMNDVCSIQLLSYIKHLIISNTNQIVGDQDFVRQFQRQLATILESSFKKYEGRRMRDCGEDLLMDISDVLYNELAFFRLMQNLDNPTSTGKIKSTVGSNQVQSVRTDRNSEPQDIEDKEDGEDKQVSKIELVQSKTKCLKRFRRDEDDETVVNHHIDTCVSLTSLQDGQSQSVIPPIIQPGTEVVQNDGSGKQDVVESTSPMIKFKKVDTDAISHDAPLVAMNEIINSKNTSNSVGNRQSSDDLLEMLSTLPTLPTVHNDSADLRRCKYEEEQESVNSLDTILSCLEGMEELAGDGASVLDPDLFLF